MKRRFADIEELLHYSLIKTPDPARYLIRQLSHIKQQAFFNKPEFLQMCLWKSPRPRRYFESNSDTKVRFVSRKVFATMCEATRVELLTSLTGVSVPTASAILTLTDPKNYGVIDIRVWQLLYRYGAVTVKPMGRGFSIGDWCDYLQKLRHWSGKLKVRARDVERSLFEYHKGSQEGRLYKKRVS